ncbi:MAG: right-handed parallel beta-helix repeat-containing protein [Planctomycetota bacterium]|jgi:hypothetical protein
MQRKTLLSGILAGIIISASAALGAERLVPSQYPTIQAGLDAAAPGDTVIVADGTYTGPGNRDLDFGGNSITVRSENGPDNCIIDCENTTGHRGFNFHSGEDANSVVDGLTITNGRASSHGGAIYCSGASPTIKNCIITGNRTIAGSDRNGHGGNATNGGGIYLLNSNAQIVNCTISNNQTGRGGHGWMFNDGSNLIPGHGGDGGHGGGIYCSNSSPAIENCTITDNQTGNGGNGNSDSSTSEPGNGGDAGHGAGIYCLNSSPILRNCTITTNRTGNGGNGSWDPPGSGGDAGHGAGIYCSNSSALTVVNTNISGNDTGSGGGPIPGGGWGGDGGGICCLDSSFSLETTTVRNNVTGGGGDPMQCGSGGGIFCQNSTATLFNCKIVNNWSVLPGAGVCCYGTFAVITGSTLSGNQSVSPDCGLFFGNWAIISNCIIWNNGSCEISGSATVTYSDIKGGWPGAGNIDADPCFVSGPWGNYYLSQITAGQASDSPCVDVGSDTAANLGMDVFTTRTDQVRDAGIVDLGYHYTGTHPDLNNDGLVNMLDYAILASQWRSEPGQPSADVAPGTGDNMVDYLDVAVLANSWLLQQ